MMRRPDYQWYLSRDLVARRLDMIHVKHTPNTEASASDPSMSGAETPHVPLREAILEALQARGVSGNSLERAAAALNPLPERVELFEIGARSSHAVSAPCGWALFTLEVQLAGGSWTHSGGPTGDKDFTRNSRRLRDSLWCAAASWVIARGGSALSLWLDEQHVTLASTPRATSALASHQALLSTLNDYMRPPMDHPQEPRRLITLAPSNLEIVEALSAHSRLIACEDSSDPSPELNASRVTPLVRLGPDLNPDLDQCEALTPDLTLSSLSVPGMERVVTGLAVRDVAQLVLAPRRLDEVCADIERVAYALGVSARGAEVSAQLRTERSELLASLPKQRARVYLEWWPKPMFTPGASCFSNELIELAGGVNIFKERQGSSVEIDGSELIAASPDICFISWCGAPYAKLNPENLRRRAGLEALNERARRHVIAIDEAYTGRPGPRMLEASRQMAHAIRDLEM